LCLFVDSAGDHIGPDTFTYYAARHISFQNDKAFDGVSLF
jgi:hypothetical protein